ncbi:MAG: hypothetical protein ACLFQ5_08495 [Oceanicaulis sp.]
MGRSAGLRIIRCELEGANVYVVRAGLIMDYRQCKRDHTLAEFEEAAAFARAET